MKTFIIDATVEKTMSYCIHAESEGQALSIMEGDEFKVFASGLTVHNPEVIGVSVHHIREMRTHEQTS